ncbi:unnamed protein product [Effrenium voratum]|nr:unnamed protein product [Effrenium voratum]
MHALRQSSGRVPISHWRPSGIPVASPKRPPQVPRIRPPATPQKEATASSEMASSSDRGGLSASPGVRPGEDLLDFNEPKDPRISRGRLPDLAEVLAAHAGFTADAGSHPSTFRERRSVSDIPDAPPSRRERHRDTRSWLEEHKEEERSFWPSCRASSSSWTSRRRRSR